MDQIRLLISAGIIGWVGLSLVATGIVFELYRIHEERQRIPFRDRWLQLTGEDIDDPDR